MAWITKPSATTQVPRREGGQPYLTAAMRQRLESEIVPRYETTLACVLPGLHMIQHEYGWIPFQAMQELGEALKVEPAVILDTASFYEEYWLKPKGKHLISVCRSIACEFCGQPALTEAIKARLGVDVGETTDDGLFTLIELECLGACGGAPAMLIDETLHENVAPADVAGLIDSAGAASPHGHRHGH
jgi:NADH:ubiquinone oxidoreductase subunit E